MSASKIVRKPPSSTKKLLSTKANGSHYGGIVSHSLTAVTGAAVAEDDFTKLFDFDTSTKHEHAPKKEDEPVREETAPSSVDSDRSFGPLLLSDLRQDGE